MELLIFILPLALLYVILIIPQQRKQKAHRELLRELNPGDEIMTTAGLFGHITEIDNETMVLEVAEGVELRFARGE